jgi:hypothetical protein
MAMITRRLHMALVHAKVDNVRRTAARDAMPRSAQRPLTAAAETSVTLRFGVQADAKRLARLAALDSAEPLARPILLAEVDGQLLAALGLCDGLVIADPFHPTADVIDLLRARAQHLGRSTKRKRSGGFRLWSRVRALVCADTRCTVADQTFLFATHGDNHSADFAPQRGSQA